MRIICLFVLLGAFGCSSATRPAATSSAAVPDSAATTLAALVYVDTASADQHPLVCGAGRDFPAGREIAFRDSQSRESVHAVFPEGVTPPKTLDGQFLLRGHYEGIRNRKIYTHKQPPEEYRYFVVSSWELKK